MDKLIYPGERTLGRLTLVLGLLAWLALIVGTLGIALVGLLVGFVFYLFARSALIAHVKGNGVELSERQFPDLHKQFVACCEKLGIDKRPSAWVLNGHGAMNAFATRFLGHEYVVLLSDVADAMKLHPDGASFYIGHELGHLRMRHLTGHLVRWPVLWLPLVGAAYARAKESTCDRHGFACSSSPENAANALGALAAGANRWRVMDVAAFRDQAREASGFWMSFHELCSGHPWLTKRVVRVTRGETMVPHRHVLSYFPAMLVPYAGRMGGGFGLLVLVYIVGTLAAVALPAYHGYVVKAKVSEAIVLSQPARAAISRYVEQNHQLPPSLADAGIAERLQGGATLSLAAADKALVVATPHGDLVFLPRQDADGHVDWRCAHRAPLKATQVPASCGEELP